MKVAVGKCKGQRKRRRQRWEAEVGGVEVVEELEVAVGGPEEVEGWRRLSAGGGGGPEEVEEPEVEVGGSEEVEKTKVGVGGVEGAEEGEGGRGGSERGGGGEGVGGDGWGD